MGSIFALHSIGHRSRHPLPTLCRCRSGQDATDLPQEGLCQGMLPLYDPSKFGIIIPNNRVISKITNDL